ncbi:MAG: protein kinase [Myxococcota bacterium]
MDISCIHCGRDFSIDAERISGISAVKCLCGQRLPFVDQQGSPIHQGRRLGKYLLINQIASGGMGQIYYGKIAGIEGFEREVAIKKMLPHMSEDPNFIEMLINEAKLTVLLNHPNIVQVYDLAKDGNEYYIAMEYVPGINGGTLLDACRRANTLMPWETAVHITMQILRGLAYAHNLRSEDGESMGILHRDITPQNVLITHNGIVKITDFGIAKARSEISTTSPGMIKGKLGYITPEQISGKIPDQRIDIFCAGIFLWESLMCKRLFKGETEIDTFRMIVDAKIPRLSDVRDDVPAKIETVLRRALAKERTERFSTADEYYNALNQALFPRSTEDLLKETQRFFARAKDFFAPVAEHKRVNISQSSPQAQASGTIVDIANILSENTGRIRRDAVEEKFPIEKTSRRSTWLFIALLIGGITAGGWIFRQPLQDLLNPEAPSTTTTAPITPPAATLAPLSGKEIQLAVDAEESRLTACYKLGNRSFWRMESLFADIGIASTGGVAKVSFDPPIDHVGPCIADKLKSLRFRPHPDPIALAKIRLPDPSSQIQNVPTSKPPRSLKPLAPHEIQTVVSRASGTLVKCLRGTDASRPSSLQAVVAIETNGHVGAVKITPSLPSSAEQNCVERVIKSLRFRKHPSQVQVTVPLNIVVKGT